MNCEDTDEQCSEDTTTNRGTNNRQTTFQCRNPRLNSVMLSVNAVQVQEVRYNQ